MSRHDDSLSLRQMRDYVAEAVALARSRTRAELDADRVFALALLKLVETVGEAASRISEPLRAAHPEIPWREIIGMRHHFVHGYDAVDMDILWNVATLDFPPLAENLGRLVS